MDTMPAPASDALTGAFVRNAWYMAMWAEDLPPGQPVGRTILGEPVVLFRRADGSPAAITDRCAHRFAPLSMGKCVSGAPALGIRVQCPYHGLQFDAEGRCVHSPYSTTIPAAAHLRAYPAAEKHRAIWVWTGSGAADTADIPDFSIIDTANPAHMTPGDCIVVEANWELIVDNLLDLSHTAYLHDGLLGNPQTAGAEIKLTQAGTTITVGRDAPATPNTAMFALQMPTAPAIVDKWNWIRWMAPSTLLLRSGISLVGSDPESGTGYYGVHILTPETQRRTRYHFTAVRWNVQDKDEATTQHIRAEIARLRRYAFAEQDGPVIEAQQQRLDEATGPLTPTLLPIDTGPVRWRRVLAPMRG